MEPEKVKQYIRTECVRLWQAKPRPQNITQRIESMARDAARHNGIPEYWRNYLPDDLLKRME